VIRNSPFRRPPGRGEDAAELGPGLAVSAVAHAALILLAIFGGPIFKADEARAVRMAEVDLISGAEFDAMISSAPEGPRGEAAPLVPPAPGEAAAPEAPAPDAPPERTEVRQAADAPAPDAAPPPSAEAAPRPPLRAPLPPAQAPAEPDAPPAPPQGVISRGLPLPAGPDNPDAPQRDAPVPTETAPPRPADRVAPTPAPPSETIAEADEATPAARRAEEAETAEPAPEQPAAAPEEATTQIVTEADETSEETTLAPVASAVPVGRPDAPARPAPAPEPQDEPAREVAAAPEAEREAEAEPRPAPSQPASRETAAAEPRPSGAPTSAPQGPALTRGQVEGVRLGIQRYWREDRVRQLPNFEDYAVTAQVRLSPEGKIVGQPEFVSPAAQPPDARWKIAFDAARIALIRAASGGFDLPPESYGRWQVIEVTFNPGGGVQF
jgi:Meckel syndrome type 1 protein